ncbi:MAG: sulfatase-like hydrolase/transferase [Desulfobacterales bacterium]|nr:sulfatase-like hydrolase/transferase [Desulfobacterales bacterium]
MTSNPSDTEKKAGARGLSRRDFLQTAGMATLAMGSGAVSLPARKAQAAAASSAKPQKAGTLKPKPYNVLFLITDQERYQPELLGKGHWPGRDRLARMGTTFENHQICSAVCTPSRSVIFTGQHIQHTRMFDNTNFPWIQDMSYDIPTIGHMMRDAGYYTTYQGKWHLNKRIHEHFPPGKPLELVGHDIMEKYGFADFTGIGDAVGDTRGGYSTDQVVTATAQAWLRRKGKSLEAQGRPWFLGLSLVNPHDVMFHDTDVPGQKVQGEPPTIMPIAPAPDDAVYRKKWPLPLSPSRKQTWDEPGRPAAHVDYDRAMGLLTGRIPNEDERWRKRQDYYLNCISDNDRAVVTILAELENLGLLENTIVIYTADHGELCGAHGMSGKGATAYREQNHVPLIVYHPDLAGGQRCGAVTSHLDLVPTILGLTGAARQQKAAVTDRLRGHDLSPLLAAPRQAAYDAVREGALYCYSMWSFMDADWLQKVARAEAAGKKMTTENLPRPDTRKRSNIRTVYDGRYKYSRYFNSQEHNRPTSIEEIFQLNDVELFDLETDPHEMINLALDSQKHDLLLVMNAKLNRLIDSEVGRDDGSHFPDIAGVNWNFEAFDP